MLRKLMAVVQAARTAPPSNLELFLGIACVMVGARAVQRYVIHQQAILGQNLATLAAIKAEAKRLDEWKSPGPLPCPDCGATEYPHSHSGGYPAAEDLAPLTTPPRRYMSDDPADAEDIL